MQISGKVLSCKKTVILTLIIAIEIMSKSQCCFSVYWWAPMFNLTDTIIRKSLYFLCPTNIKIVFVMETNIFGSFLTILLY